MRYLMLALGIDGVGFAECLGHVPPKKKISYLWFKSPDEANGRALREFGCHPREVTFGCRLKIEVGN